MNSIIQKHPLLFAVGVVLVHILIVVAGILWLPLLHLSPYWLACLNTALQLLFVLMVFFLTGCWRQIRFFGRLQRHQLLLLIFPLLLALFYLVNGISVPTEMLFLQVPLMLMIGLNEELMSRGIVLYALRPYGVMKAVTITACLFGLQHLSHLMSYPADITLAHILLNIFYGFGYAALFWRIKILWPLVLLHALTDYTGTVAAFFPLMIEILLNGLLALYGLYLLRDYWYRSRKVSSLSENVPH